MSPVRIEKPPGSLQGAGFFFFLLPCVAVVNYVSEVFLPSWANSGHRSKKVLFTQFDS